MSRFTWTLLVAAAWIAAGAGGAASIQDQKADPSSSVNRFLTQPDTPLSSYRALRWLSASNKRYGATGWIEVRTEFDAERGMRYEILDEGGSGYIRNRVLRKVLERESRARSAGEAERAALTLANYQFGAPAHEGDGLVRVAILPLRNEELLVNGSIVLTSPGDDLIRIEGRLAKNPSIWTRRVEVVRRYGRINGVRVPLDTLSTANVMVAGTSTFSMCYDYESINGAPVVPRGSCRPPAKN